VDPVELPVDEPEPTAQSAQLGGQSQPGRPGADHEDVQRPVLGAGAVVLVEYHGVSLALGIGRCGASELIGSMSQSAWGSGGGGAAVGDDRGGAAGTGPVLGAC
jgi:hypothetical protein